MRDVIHLYNDVWLIFLDTYCIHMSNNKSIVDKLVIKNFLDYGVTTFPYSDTAMWRNEDGTCGNMENALTLGWIYYMPNMWYFLYVIFICLHTNSH